MKRCTLVLFLVACTACGQGSISVTQATMEDTERPWFCHDLDCPKFKVVNTTDNYEIRAYPEGKWATTQVQSLLYSVGLSEGFKRLFDYISGENEDNKKIEMTAPVPVFVQPGQGPFCKSNFTVNFFVPFDYQGNKSPPKPSNPDVYISTNEATHLAVSQFGGFVVDDWSVIAKAKKLQDALDADGVSYHDNGFFSAGYDPPFRVSHRHNEIWIPLKEKTDVIAQSLQGKTQVIAH